MVTGHCKRHTWGFSLLVHGDPYLDGEEGVCAVVVGCGSFHDYILSMIVN